MNEILLKDTINKLGIDDIPENSYPLDISLDLFDKSIDALNSLGIKYRVIKNQGPFKRYNKIYSHHIKIFNENNLSKPMLRFQKGKYPNNSPFGKKSSK